MPPSLRYLQDRWEEPPEEYPEEQFRLGTALQSRSLDR